MSEPDEGYITNASCAID